MRVMRSGHRLPLLTALIVGATLSLAAPGLAASAAAGHPAAAAHPNTGVAPRATGGLDCNGLSPIQRPVKVTLACADPRGSDKGRFTDNGRYIGHDEPSVRYISGRPGSGSNVTFTERLPVDPQARADRGAPGP